MINIFKKEHIFVVEEDLKNVKKVINFISKKAVELKLANDFKALTKGFLKREQQGTTGMDNFIAIPHAITTTISQLGIIILLLKKPTKWKTLDNVNQVKFVIALLVPKDKRNQEHMGILSSIAQKLLDEKTHQALNSYDIEQVYKALK